MLYYFNSTCLYLTIVIIYSTHCSFLKESLDNTLQFEKNQNLVEYNIRNGNISLTNDNLFDLEGSGSGFLITDKESEIHTTKEATTKNVIGNTGLDSSSDFVFEDELNSKENEITKSTLIDDNIFKESEISTLSDTIIEHETTGTEIEVSQIFTSTTTQTTNASEETILSESTTKYRVEDEKETTNSGESTTSIKIDSTLNTEKSIKVQATEEKSTTEENQLNYFSLCTEPGQQKICSGSGFCNKGVCACNADSTDELYRYSGKYCEECPYCKGQRCTKILPCVKCKVVHKNKDCSNECFFPGIVLVDTVERHIENDDKMCDLEFDIGCYIKYKYNYKENGDLYVETETKYSCFNGSAYLIYLLIGMMTFLICIIMLTPRACSINLFDEDKLEVNNQQTIRSNLNRRSVIRRSMHSTVE